jgi:hypothetical protein
MHDFVDSDFFTIFYPLVLTGMIIIGFWIAKKYYFKRQIAWKASGIENGILGLFGLLISFTLLMSGNAQKERTAIVHQVADGVAQMKIAADVLVPEDKKLVYAYLRRHIDLHLGLYERVITRHEELVNELNELNEAFWPALHYRGDSVSFNQDIPTLLPIYNQLNSASFKLTYSYSERIPPMIYLLITLSSWLLAILVGFMNGFYEKRHYLVPLIYLVIVSLMMQAIRDIDNPYKGSVKPKYDNLRNLRTLL